MRKKMLAAFAAAALAAAPALAEPWTKGYGGSGADRLTELVEYEGGRRRKTAIWKRARAAIRPAG